MRALSDNTNDDTNTLPSSHSSSYRDHDSSLSSFLEANQCILALPTSHIPKEGDIITPLYIGKSKAQ
jgi:hypothetical protein